MAVCDIMVSSFQEIGQHHRVSDYVSSGTAACTVANTRRSTNAGDVELSLAGDGDFASLRLVLARAGYRTKSASALVKSDQSARGHRTVWIDAIGRLVIFNRFLITSQAFQHRRDIYVARKLAAGTRKVFVSFFELAESAES